MKLCIFRSFKANFRQLVYLFLQRIIDIFKRFTKTQIIFDNIFSNMKFLYRYYCCFENVTYIILNNSRNSNL